LKRSARSTHLSFAIARGAVTLGTACVLLFGCAGAQTSKHVRHEFYEMQSETVRIAYSLSNTDEYVGWLDRDRVMFVGNALIQRDSKQSREQALFIWNLQTGSVTRHTKLPLRSTMCLADNFISYFLERDRSLLHVAGTVGSEMESDWAPGHAPRAFEVNPFTCRLYRRANIPAPKFGGVVYPLASGDGWIERIEGGAWVYGGAGVARPVEVRLPTLGPLSLYPHKYSRFARKYLFYHGYGSVRETWLLSADGSLAKMEFPEGSWGTGNIEPVADGLVLRSRSINTKAEWGVGHAGLYYHSPLLGTQKLISGVIYALAVNSDGCRLAATGGHGSV
jgi:hypothetical protein